MKQVPQPEGLPPNQPNDCSTSDLVEGTLAVCRGRDRGEPEWVLDVRRAAARLDAMRASLRRARSQEEGSGGRD
jgi:hypothetical protein